MPFIHRAFCHSYQGATELFIPLNGNCFMRKDNSKEAWFQAEIDRRYINAHTQRVVQLGFELFQADEKHFIRRKRRFRWSGRDIENSINVNHNWLLSEFIRVFPAQFVYGMASEITGLEFLRPDAF